MPLRDFIETQLPHVKAIVGEIDGGTLVPRAGEIIRERLHAAGFRVINGGEDILRSLYEAETYFAERDDGQQRDGGYPGTEEGQGTPEVVGQEQVAEPEAGSGGPETSGLAVDGASGE